MIHTPPAPAFTTSSAGLLYGGERWLAIGANCYFLAWAPEPVQRQVLDDVRSSGWNTLRTWTFFEDDRPALLASLDRLLALAAEYGVFLILPLLNYWPDFGGVPRVLNELKLTGDPNQFFILPAALDNYLESAFVLLSRLNPLTGRLYCQEPAILAWELMNEPRCPGDTSGKLLLRWVGLIASALKNHLRRMGSSQLLAVGDEGFLRRPWWAALGERAARHLYDGRYGVDAAALLAIPEIDFGTFHWYPEPWAVPLAFGERWIKDHLALAKHLGKPVFLEEFGLRQPAAREYWYSRWAAAMTVPGSCGALFWNVGCTSSGFQNYCDEYTISCMAGNTSWFVNFSLPNAT